MEGGVEVMSMATAQTVDCLCPKSHVMVPFVNVDPYKQFASVCPNALNRSWNFVLDSVNSGESPQFCSLD